MDIEKSGKSIEDDKKQGRRAMPNTVDLATFYKQNGFCILPLMRGAKKSVTKWKGYSAVRQPRQRSEPFMPSASTRPCILR